jgi:hypothetical protein
MAEQPSMGSGKIHNGWRKNPPLLSEILALAEKFRAMVCDNFPGKFRHRQVVVLRHELSGLKLSGILFAVYSLIGTQETGHHLYCTSAWLVWLTEQLFLNYKN